MTTLNSNPPVIEVETLLRELNHRINAQFASAVDFISVQAVRAESAEAKAVLADAAELLHGHAGVRRALLMPRHARLIDATRYLRKLWCALRGTVLGRSSIQLTMKGDRLPLEPKRCWRLGLIVHELVMNATKDACLEAESGEIEIKLVRTGGVLECVVSDTMSAARASHGPGLQIVGDLAKTLNGRIKQGTGLRSIVICFPLTERERRASDAIDSRRLRSLRRVRSMPSRALGEGGTKTADRDTRTGVARAQDPNGLSARAGEWTSACCADVLGGLLSPSLQGDVR